MDFVSHLEKSLLPKVYNWSEFHFYFFRSDFLQNPYFKRFPDFYCESVFRGSYNYCLTWETSPVPLLLPWRRYNTPTSVDHRRRSVHIGQVNFTKFVLFQILWRFGMAFGPLIHFEVVEEINSFLTWKIWRIVQ